MQDNIHGAYVGYDAIGDVLVSSSLSTTDSKVRFKANETFLFSQVDDKQGLIGVFVTDPTAQVDIRESSDERASLRIRAGSDPASLNDGDIWFDGTDLKMRVGGVTKTFVMV